MKKGGRYKSAFLLIFLLSFQAIADDEQAKIASEGMIASRIDKTGAGIREALEFVESDLANLIVDENKKFLDDAELRNGLSRMIKARRGQDGNAAVTVTKTFSSLQQSLKFTPGVMGRDALANRALLIRDIAAYYDKHDPAMCRYLPGDFNVLLNIDMPWLTEADESILKQSILDEKASIILMLNGVLPNNVNDSDTAMSLSNYVSGWFSELPSSDSYRIARKRLEGNYCVLWSRLLNDIVSELEDDPNITDEVLAPLFLTSSRGWLDSGLWSVSQAIKENN